MNKTQQSLDKLMVHLCVLEEFIARDEELKKIKYESPLAFADMVANLPNNVGFDDYLYILKTVVYEEMKYQQSLEKQEVLI